MESGALSYHATKDHPNSYACSWYDVQTPLIREPCIQLGVKYHLITLTKDDNQLELTVKLAKLLESAVLKPDSHGLIFSPSRKTCESVSQALECELHHSKRRNDDNQISLKKWIEHKGSPWMSSTPGLSQGLNLAYIDAIIFVGYPYGLIDMVQGCGRGNRNGRPCYAVVIDTKDESWREENAESDASYNDNCNPEMVQWCQSNTRCHRWIIQQTMDGEGKIYKDIPGALSCEKCNPHDPITQCIRNIWTSAVLPIQMALASQGLKWTRSDTTTESTIDFKRMRTSRSFPVKAMSLPVAAVGPQSRAQASLQQVRSTLR